MWGEEEGEYEGLERTSLTTKEYLEIAYWQYEAVSGANFDVLQEPMRGLCGGRKI